MCGVAGIFLKKGIDRLGPQLVNMLELIHHRGMDSSGVALYGEIHPRRYRYRVAFRGASTAERIRDILSESAGIEPGVIENTNSSYQTYTGVVEADEAETKRIYHELNAQPESCVHSFSPNMLVIKDLGAAQNLTRSRYLEEFSAYHGIGHVRLATESIDNLNYAHPFTSELYPSLSIVHNGQLTNYFNMRRRLERKGVQFKTNNDSEIIAHYLAYRMAYENKTLPEAMRLAIDDLDGVFTCMVATDKELGIFQDRLGLKPVVIYELPDMILLGSERICFAHFPSEAGTSWEIGPGEVYVWSH